MQDDGNDHDGNDYDEDERYQDEFDTYPMSFWVGDQRPGWRRWLDNLAESYRYTSDERKMWIVSFSLVTLVASILAAPEFVPMRNGHPTIQESAALLAKQAARDEWRWKQLDWMPEHAPACPLNNPCNGDYPVGKVASNVRVEPSDRRMVDMLGARLSLPTATVLVDIDKAPGTRLSLFDWGIDTKGRIVPTNTGILSVGYFAVLAMVLLGFGNIAGYCVFKAEYDGSGIAFFETPNTRLVSGFVSACAFAVVMGNGTDPWIGAMVTLCLLSLGANKSTRRRYAMGVVAAFAGWSALTTKMIEPLPAIAGLYGPLGIHSWDVVILVALAFVAAAVAIRRPRAT